MHKKLSRQSKAQSLSLCKLPDLSAACDSLYAALMSYGCTLETFERFMALLIKERKLEKRGQLYFIKEAK